MDLTRHSLSKSWQVSDGGFPGIGQAADDINEAGGWEQCFS